MKTNQLTTIKLVCKTRLGLIAVDSEDILQLEDKI